MAEHHGRLLIRKYAQGVVLDIDRVEIVLTWKQVEGLIDDLSAMLPEVEESKDQGDKRAFRARVKDASS